MTTRRRRSGEEEPRSSVPARSALRLMAAAAAIGIAGLGLYLLIAWDAKNMVAVELAGNTDGITRLVDGAVDVYRRALLADLLLIAAYVTAIVGIARVTGRALITWPSWLTGTAQAAGIAAGVLDLAENAVLYRFLGCLPGGSSCSEGLAQAAQALAFTKFVLLIGAFSIIVPAAITVVTRAARSLSGRGSHAPAGLRPVPAPDPDRPDDSPAAWAADAWVPRDLDGDRLGVCLSGGGIRSATFSLGALSVLRDHVLEASHLVTVSGGGYAAGAIQHALDPATDRSTAEPEDAFTDGTPELDHLRRHGKYLADGVGEWLVALGVVLRGLLANVALFLLAIVVLARLLAHGYRGAGLTYVDPEGSGVPFTQLWPLPPGIVWALAVTVTASFLLWGVALLLEPWADGGRRRVIGRLHTAAQWTIAVAALVGLLGVVVPAIAWLSDIERLTGLDPQQVDEEATAGGIAVTAVGAGYLGTLAIILWRGRTRVGRLTAWVREHAGRLDTPIVQRLLVGLGLAGLAGGLLIVLGQVLQHTGGASALAGQDWVAWEPVGAALRRFGLREWHVTAAVAAVLAVMVALVDQTRWSLHPFYKRRLASAFAVRRTREPDGRPSAEAYPFEEMTALSQYGQPEAPFPQLVFSTAAHASGQRWAPPGRRVVGFTFSHDVLGGPVTDWVATADVEERSSPVLRLDLTLQAAMAISGAAFASAMGRHTRPFDALLALSNARLGTWVPNPRHLQRLAEDPDDWRLPRLPRTRRATYLLREILGIFSLDDPLLFVSDGGHYENLGLVELLRLRPRTIISLDASGDPPGMPTGLAEAVTLAYEELGVEFQFPEGDVEALAPGSATVPDDSEAALADVSDRLSRRCTLAARFRYPDDPPGTWPGRLVYGRALLTLQTPWWVLMHAVHEERFPSDATGDQWFDHAQFDAYHALGRHVASQMLELLSDSTSESE